MATYFLSIGAELDTQANASNRSLGNGVRKDFYKVLGVTIRGAQPSARLSEESCLSEHSQGPLRGSFRGFCGVSARLCEGPRDFPRVVALSLWPWGTVGKKASAIVSVPAMWRRYWISVSAFVFQKEICDDQAVEAEFSVQFLGIRVASGVDTGFPYWVHIVNGGLIAAT